MSSRPTVVILHGLARTGASVAGLRRHIAAAGYPTWARSYPSRRMPIAELAQEIAQRIRAEVGDRELMAVTHSLGGVVLRHMAGLLPWRGAVMIAPPNQGSRVARALGAHPWFRWYYGPAGQELGHPSGWPEPPRPFGVIAGTRGLSLGNPVSWGTHGLGLLWRGEPSDGTVAVAETRLPGMADFATVDASHTWILRHRAVRAWVLRFLDQGRFDGR